MKNKVISEKSQTDNLSNFLTLYRRKLNITHDRLSKMTGISRQSLYSWENKIKSPTLANIEKLSRAIGVNSNELLTGLVTKIPDHKPPQIKMLFETASTIATEVMIENGLDEYSELLENPYKKDGKIYRGQLKMWIENEKLTTNKGKNS